MKKILLALLTIAIGFSACNKEPQPLTKQQIDKKIDSIAAYRIKELDQQAQQDLEYRRQIEVKVKADSIINAAMTRGAADSPSKTKAVTGGRPAIR